MYKNACISTTLKCLNMCKHWIGSFRLAFRLSELSFLTKFTIINCPHQLQISINVSIFLHLFYKTGFVSYVSLEILRGELAHRHPKLIPSHMPHIWSLCYTNQMKLYSTLTRFWRSFEANSKHSLKPSGTMKLLMTKSW